MQDILINWAPQETRVAIVENGAVQELHFERELERGRVGNIYTGKVARVLPGMQSAFIEIGLERAAFLHIADVLIGNGTSRNDHGPGAVPPPPIERVVFEGQTLTVQVIKDPIGTKGARLSTQVSIAGRLLVFLPQDTHIGISQKIGSQELREQLRARMTALSQQDRDATGDTGGGDKGTENGGGFILRTNAAEASDAELADDIRYLRKTWAQVRERAFKSPPGTLLHEDLSLGERVLRDLVDDSHADHPHRLARAVRGAVGVRPRVHARRRRQAPALHRRAADLRPLRHRRGDRQGADAPGRSEVGRLSHHRPDRGADDGRREHRRLRRRAQLR